MQMNSRVWGIYIIKRFWSNAIFWSRFKLIFIHNEFLCICFWLFYEKMLQMFINDFRSVPKSILQKFLLINFITHTLEIPFTTYWDNSWIFTTAVKLFVAEIHTKISKFTFSAVFIAKFIGQVLNFVIQ